MPARVAHHIRPLVRSGVPERMVVLDTEAHSELSEHGERQTFALAAAEYLRVRPGAGVELVRARAYEDARALWSEIRDYTRPRHRTVVWCHNLAYDLRVSGALRELPALGLSLEGIVLEHTSSWAAFRGAERTVLCCDLYSWLPASLKKIAADMGMRQLRLDHGESDPAALLRRCVRDVQITRAAVAQLLSMIDAEDLGPWRATGSGQSHAAWRKRFMNGSPLAHEDASALDAERRAMWTGRCECWRWGKVKELPAVEYDLTLAYCNIAASSAVPGQLVGRTAGTHGWQLIPAMRKYAVLAECEVETSEPLAPTSHGSLVHWPVGRFQTTLWDPELRLLYERGAKVRVSRAWLYQRTQTLVPFASWLLQQLDESSSTMTAVQRRALKHFSRTLIGRFALRYRSWEKHSQLPDFGLRLGELHDLDTGEVSDCLHVGHDMLVLSDMTDAEDSVPQITGWVMSEARARLWRLCELAGVENVLYMDTDSLIVTPAGADWLELAVKRGLPWPLRRKAHYPALELLGPRQLLFGRGRRVAGVPVRAARVSRGVYEGETWRSLRESIARGEAEAVVLEHKRFTLAATDNRREHLPDGATAPHRVG